MPAQITNYQCPSCTGPLHFVGSTGRLECDYCGSSFSVQEIEALYAEKEAAAVEAGKKAGESSQQQAQENTTDWSAGMRAYNCPSCGAELICDETTAATSCPYCGNPTVVPGQFSGMKKPDLIIPFRLDREAAVSALTKHYKGKPFLPKAFTEKNHIEEVKGVYVPFWLYSGTADADVTFEATRSHTRETSRERIVTTEHYNVQRAGSVAYENVPVDASTKMPDEHMDSIEPYDYSDLTGFSTAYLPGFLADKFDVDSAASAERAEERCKQSALEAMAATVVGYETCVPRDSRVAVHSRKPKYAMMPVWLLSTRWNGKSYLFAMNGQTGKIVGDLPVDKGKFWLRFVEIFVPMAAALSLLLLR